MRSMTGYGRSTVVIDGRTVTIQVNSVNRKSLDLTMRLPNAWELLESSINDRVRRVAARGKVHVEVELTMTGGAAAYSWDDDAVNAALDRLEAFAKRRGIGFSPSTELVWGIANSQRRGEDLPEVETVREPVLAGLDAALIGFVEMREKEGGTLLVDFLSRLEILRTQCEIVAERSPGVVAHYREQLLQRLKQVGLELDITDERVLKEVALFADRCDLTEEITRFRSHLDQFRTLLKSSGEIGRKGEFILQEMGREVHTMGSKANDLIISRAVIELKNELERVREQIANVE